MGVAGLIHVLLYAVPSIESWSVRPVDLRFWGFDIVAPAAFAVLMVLAYKRRITDLLAQAAAAVGVLFVMQAMLSFLRTAWEYGLDSAGAYGIWDAFALMLFSSLPTGALFIIAFALSEVVRLSTGSRLLAAERSHGLGS